MAEYGPPRNGIIFFFVVLSVITLASLKPAFDSYYDSMYQSNVDDRLETYSDLGQMRDAQARWDNELRSIDEDIERIANARPESVVPRHDDEMNLDPLVGWNQLPQEAPERAVPEPVEEEVSPEGDVPAEGAPTEPAPSEEPDAEGVTPEDEPLPGE